MQLGRYLANSILVLALTIGAMGQQQRPSQAYWTTLNPPPGYQIGPVWLLTDGTILALAAAPSNCVEQPPYCYPTEAFRLIPDDAGSYTDGTWLHLISMPADYGPVGFAAAVLADGRVIMEGGEENQTQQNWTTKGYVLDPTGPSWTAVTPSAGWASIGDAPGIVLNDGTFMLGDCCEGQPPPELVAQFVPTTFSLLYVQTSGKLDSNSEEGWTLLPYESSSPAGTFLTVDTNVPGETNYEIFDSADDTWTPGNVGFQLYGHGNEIGPQVLRADGSVFVVGASDGAHPGHTGIYTAGVPLGSWTQGPDLPSEGGLLLSGADTGAALLTSGNVLIGANTVSTPATSYFFEFDGTNLNPTNPAPPSGTVTGAMLMLPTGQVLLTDLFAMHNPIIYTPAGYLQPPSGGPWAPTITSISTPPFTRGHTYQVSGTLFNGMSQANMFGDDLQNATNYPLVRLSLATFAGPSRPVTYCRTYGHTSMAVAAQGLIVTTNFVIPSGIAAGSYYLEVVANGISSGYYGPFQVN